MAPAKLNSRSAVTVPIDRKKLPSVDAVLRASTGRILVERFGRVAAGAAIRSTLTRAREVSGEALDADQAALAALARLEADTAPKLGPVFNLTGTVLHTNLGRALLAEEAIDAAVLAMRNPINLEFDLEGSRRGDRDDAVRGLLRELTGAEDATVVNNNAAAVFLTLNSLANRMEAIVSRGELVEIGGAFRLPEIVKRAGARLVEVGTTNRTHFSDYAEAIHPRTGLLLKVHRSNYRIEGFTAEVSTRELAPLAAKENVPLVTDLGSGTLVDLATYGLPAETTVAQSVAAGADLVTFSGDKLLGGPQAGFIVGRKDLLSRINRNPIKRALRMDKIRLAALEGTLGLYRHPERLVQRLPTLRAVTRDFEEIETSARRLVEPVAARVGNAYCVTVVGCSSQVGSGTFPVETLPSAGLSFRSAAAGRGGRTLNDLSAALRRLPRPVIGRIVGRALVLDLRCLEDENGFLDNLNGLA